MIATPNQYMPSLMHSCNLQYSSSAHYHNNISCTAHDAFYPPRLLFSLFNAALIHESPLLIFINSLIFPLYEWSKCFIFTPFLNLLEFICDGAGLAVLWRNIYFCNIFLALLVCVACHRVWIHRRKQHGSRDPKTWPILGSQLEASHNYDRLLDWTTSFFTDEHRTIKMSFLSRRSYYTVDPASVEYILKTNFHNFPKGVESHHRLFDLLGNGILNTDGSMWKVHRKLGSLEFSIKKLRQLSSTVYKSNALKLLKVLANSNQGVDVQDLLLDMTFHSICEVVFGSEFHGIQSSNIGEGANSIAAALDNAQEMLTRRYVYPWWRIQRFFNIGSERVFREDISKFNQFLTNVIDQRWSQMQKEAPRLTNADVHAADIKEQSEAQDLLSRFLCNRAHALNTCDGAAESMERVRDAMMSFVLAGRDTTASTLSWFLYCMCIHPDKQETVYQELIKLEYNVVCVPLDTKSGSNVDESTKIGSMDEVKSRQMKEFAEKVLTYETLQSSNMPYLHSAVAETLRLYPAVPRDGKVALKDDMLPDGTHLKAGDQVAYIPYAMGRMPFLWGHDALVFKPERWLLNGTFQPESPFKFTAFQAGPRMCLGKDAAYLQMKITAALLLRFFHFEIVSNHPVEYRMMNVMTMKHGLRVNVTAR